MILTGETEVLGMSPSLHIDKQVNDCVSHVTTKLPYMLTKIHNFVHYSHVATFILDYSEETYSVSHKSLYSFCSLEMTANKNSMTICGT